MLAELSKKPASALLYRIVLDDDFAAIPADDVFECADVPGIAVQLQNPEDLESLAAIPNVVAVRPIQIFHAPETIDRRILSGPEDPKTDPFGQSTHYMTGVDHVHEHGIAGKGIKIGIIDTGVDYLHPNLGGAFGPGNKVAGGYDFVGDDFNGYWRVV